jgi:hypothetical protein
MESPSATLHIEHPITDFDSRNAAFVSVAEVRQQAGVRQQRIQRPADDPAYVVVGLDFDTIEEAEKFLGFPQANIWTSSENAPCSRRGTANADPKVTVHRHRTAHVASPRRDDCRFPWSGGTGCATAQASP